MSGNTEEALQALAEIPSAPIAIEDKITDKATRGLIAMRAGDALTGSNLYLEALKLAAESKSVRLYFRAVAHFASEAARLDPKSGAEILNVAIGPNKERFERAKTSSPDIKVLEGKVRTLEAASVAADESHQKWAKGIASNLPVPIED